MAPDQRYCIECGERRTGGGLRDSLPRTQAAAPVASAPRRAWLTPSSSLIAGVATLLLAMGVGVLIGRSGGDNSSRADAAPPVVTVSSGTAGTTVGDATATTAADSAKSTGSSRTKSKGSKSKSSGSTAVEQTAKKNGVKLPPKVVKVGQKCDKGAKGCQGGKFTGNFFGGG